jgi:hypothetical protein
MGPPAPVPVEGGVGVKAFPAGGAGPWTTRDPFEHVSHRHRFPLRAPRRRDAARVQGGGNLPKRLRSCGLRLTDRRHDCGGVRLGVGLYAPTADHFNRKWILPDFEKVQ